MRCVVCAGKGLTANHRLGGLACKAKTARKVKTPVQLDSRKQASTGRKETLAKESNREMEVEVSTPDRSVRAGSVVQHMAECNLGPNKDEIVVKEMPMEVDPVPPRETESAKDKDSDEMATMEYPVDGESWTVTENPEGVSLLKISRKDTDGTSNVQ